MYSLYKTEGASGRLLVCVPTGGGKTVIMGALAERVLKANPGCRILILSHKKETSDQIIKTLDKDFYINSFYINSNVKHVSQNVMSLFSVFVATEMSYFNRRSLFGKFDIVMLDECHLNHFKKHIANLSDGCLFGFTATPLRVGGGLRKDFKTIDMPTDVHKLVGDQKLSKLSVFVPEKVINNSEIDVDAGINAETVYKAYLSHSKGKKTIIFNIRVKQSIEIMKYFRMKWVDCRHLDGGTDKENRKEIIDWFRRTPSAVMTNVTVCALGFDVKDIDTVIINRRTGSLPLYMQMIGRGSRINEGKQGFKVVDLGGNVFRIGSWEGDKGWKKHFEFGEKRDSRRRVPQFKACPDCGKILSVYKRKCDACGHVFTRCYFDNLKKEAERFTEVKYGISVALICVANEKKVDNGFKVIGKIIRRELRRRKDITPEEARKDYWFLTKKWSERTGIWLTEDHLREVNKLR